MRYAVLPADKPDPKDYKLGFASYRSLTDAAVRLDYLKLTRPGQDYIIVEVGE